MAAGKSIVVSRIAPLTEIVLQERRAMCERARRRVRERFSVEVMGAAMLAVYDTVRKRE